MNQKLMINNRMQKKLENTFAIRPKFVVKDSTPIFEFELDIAHNMLYVGVTYECELIVVKIRTLKT